MESKREDGVSFEDICSHYKNINVLIKSHETAFETIIEEFSPKKEQDINKIELGSQKKAKSVPIYLSTYREKDIFSAYLKTKRKGYQNADEIPDIVGFRILCLFEENVFSVFENIAKSLRVHGYIFSKISAYSWEIAQKVRLNEIWKPYTDLLEEGINHSRKLSGYKAIHVNICKSEGSRKLNIEIQIKSLLQHVWAELEHALKYKQGNVSEYISKSFISLSKSLQSADDLLNDLYKSANRDRILSENKTEELIDEDRVPTRYYYYDKDFNLDLEGKDCDSKTVDEYLSYCDKWVCLSNAGDKMTKTFVTEAKGLFDSIDDALHKFYDYDRDIAYWIKMEKAFYLFAFAEKEYSSAFNAYMVYKEEYPDKYMPYFRLGELFYLNDSPEVALRWFDKCEKAINDNPSNVHPRNIFYLYTKLATVYWSMGSEYLALAIEKIDEAERKFNQNATMMHPLDEISLNNNLCYYYLERYCLNKKKYDEQERIQPLAELDEEKRKEEKEKREELKRKIDEDFNIAQKCYDVLNSHITNGSSKSLISSNAIDTAAWFCYQQYLKLQEGCSRSVDVTKSLKDAYIHVLRLQKKQNPNNATSILRSEDLQHTHRREIIYQYAHLKRGQEPES